MAPSTTSVALVAVSAPVSVKQQVVVTRVKNRVPAVVPAVGFEGGQMPMHRRLPKRGFKSHLLQFNAEVTLTSLEVLGLAEVDMLVLKQARLIGQLAKVVKVINTGAITKAVKLNGIGATAGAKAAIEAAGGSVA